MTNSISVFKDIHKYSQKKFASISETNDTDLNFTEISRVPVATYHNGLSNCVIYSDKFCIQSGFQSGVTTANTFQKIPLIAPYENTAYTVFATLAGNSTTDYRIKVGDGTVNLTDGFMLSLGNAGAEAFWNTEGYVSNATFASAIAGTLFS